MSACLLQAPRSSSARPSSRSSGRPGGRSTISSRCCPRLPSTRHRPTRGGDGGLAGELNPQRRSGGTAGQLNQAERLEIPRPGCRPPPPLGAGPVQVAQMKAGLLACLIALRIPHEVPCKWDADDQPIHAKRRRDLLHVWLAKPGQVGLRRRGQALPRPTFAARNPAYPARQAGARLRSRFARQKGAMLVDDAGDVARRQRECSCEILSDASSAVRVVGWRRMPFIRYCDERAVDRRRALDGLYSSTAGPASVSLTSEHSTARTIGPALVSSTVC